MKKLVLNAMEKLIKNVAVNTVNSQSPYACYEPEVPAKLKGMSKNK